jgi:glycosyltransferase involved in cell wall biosynthesis
MSSIGLAIVAHNEGSLLPAAIAQFYHAVSDIVVVDGGSSDSTVSWANRMGARVFSKALELDFSAQKNFAIKQLATEWVYVHAPDERVEPDTLDLLPLLISPEGQQKLIERGILPYNEGVFDCFGFARKTFVDGVRIPGYPDYQYRLFRRYCSFEGRAYESLVGFKNRAEIDAEILSDTCPTSRFNILRYQSRVRQEYYDVLRRKIKGDQ